MSTKLYTWCVKPTFIAVAQAESIASARALLLQEQELGESGDGSCPERDAAREYILNTYPAIWVGQCAEFALTDSAELREQEAYADTLLAKIATLEAQLVVAKAEGATEMLERVRATLREYPYIGGDVEVMKEVERLRAEGLSKKSRRLQSYITACQQIIGTHDDLQVAIVALVERAETAEQQNQNLRAQVVALTAERDKVEASTDTSRIAKLEAIIEADRTYIIDGVNGVERALNGRFWLTEGRGSYEWNDDRYQEEFAAAARDVLKALEPLRKIGADLTNCPQTTAEVIAARTDKDERIATLESQVAALVECVNAALDSSSSRDGSPCKCRACEKGRAALADLPTFAAAFIEHAERRGAALELRQIYSGKGSSTEFDPEYLLLRAAKLESEDRLAADHRRSQGNTHTKEKTNAERT